MLDLRPIEIFLVQFIIYMILWMTNDFVASLLTLIFTSIICFVLLISLITEWIEPSKVPKWYFKTMLVSIAAPVLAAIIYVIVLGGEISWIN